jgi:hypothetical protein
MKWSCYRELGYRVTRAASAQGALGALAAGRSDLADDRICRSGRSGGREGGHRYLVQAVRDRGAGCRTTRGVGVAQRNRAMRKDAPALNPADSFV